MDVLRELALSPGAIEILHQFQGLIEKWTPRINLVAKSTVAEIWPRHIVDSARLCLVPVPSLRLWADLGAGAGLPGIVVAVILQEKAPEARVILVESNLRKATFLREAARKLSLSVEVRSERAEKLVPIGADVVSARALASLDVLCGLGQRHMAPNGLCLFPKGERFGEEVKNARQNWRFDLEARENLDHKGSALLVLRNLSRAV